MISLSEYLRLNSIRQADFAARIGVTQGTVSRLCTGRLLPDMETAAKIQRETRGEVPVAMWVPEEYRTEPVEQQKGAA